MCVTNKCLFTISGPAMSTLQGACGYLAISRMYRHARKLASTLFTPTRYGISVQCVRSVSDHFAFPYHYSYVSLILCRLALIAMPLRYFIVRACGRVRARDLAALTATRRPFASVATIRCPPLRLPGLFTTLAFLRTFMAWRILAIEASPLR